MLPVAKEAVCILHLDYSFSSRFLHCHREDAPEALPSQAPPASKILKGDEVSKVQATPALTATNSQRGGGAQAGQEERTELSDHCQDTDQGHELQQEGGIIKNGNKKIVITVYCRQLKL